MAVIALRYLGAPLVEGRRAFVLPHLVTDVMERDGARLPADEHWQHRALVAAVRQTVGPHTSRYAIGDTIIGYDAAGEPAFSLVLRAIHMADVPALSPEDLGALGLASVAEVQARLRGAERCWLLMTDDVVPESAEGEQ